MYRIGIIGWVERMASFYHALIHDIKDVEVLAIAAQDRAFKTKAMEDGVKHVFSSPDQLYELHQLDIILVFGKLEDRVEHVQKSLSADVDLWIDYPLASNVEDAEIIATTIKRYPSQKVLTVLPRRYDRDFNSIKQLIDDQAVGSIRSISLKHTFRQEKEKEEKGVFIHQAIEDIDTIHSLLENYISDVHAVGVKGETVDDASIAYVTGHAGETAFNLQLIRSKNFESLHIDIVGSAGSIHSEIGAGKSKISFVSEGAYHDIVHLADDKYSDIFRSFLEKLRKGQRPTDITQDHIAAIRVAVAMTKSFMMDTIEEIEHK